MARADRIEGSVPVGGAGDSGRAIAGKASGARAGLTSTGKAKVQEYQTSSTKKYEPPVKGSGKPKYQNVIKEARVDTKAPRKEEIKNVRQITKAPDAKVSKKEITRKASNEPNIAKQIDREYKVEKGVRTESPSTPKVPVKGSQKGHVVTSVDRKTGKSK